MIPTFTTESSVTMLKFHSDAFKEGYEAAKQFDKMGKTIKNKWDSWTHNQEWNDWYRGWDAYFTQDKDS